MSGDIALYAAGAAALAGAGAGFGLGRLREDGAGTAAPQEPLEPAQGTWTAVATVGDVRPGRIVRFASGGVEGVVVSDAGGLRALSIACTDQGCTLTPDAASGRLLCPCHPVSFDLDGRPSAPAVYGRTLRPLPTIRTRVRGDAVEVWVPAQG